VNLGAFKKYVMSLTEDKANKLRPWSWALRGLYSGNEIVQMRGCEPEIGSHGKQATQQRTFD
jgi:hypothetical protein